MYLDNVHRDLLLGGLYKLGIVKTSIPMVSSEKEASFIEEKIDLFSQFIEELFLWNWKTNLIGRASIRDVIIRHVLDSLSVYYLLKNKKASILDIGAGAGFPSVPLAVVDNTLSICAVEKRHKRASFLKNVAVLLRLGNFSVIEGDVKDIKGSYDIVLARGVGELLLLYELTKKILKEKAMIIAFKGKITEIEKEVSRLKGKNSNKGMNLNIQHVKVPYLDEEERNIVIIETK